MIPVCRKNKGDWYLINWWHAAKRWNLLAGRLKDLSDLQGVDGAKSPLPLEDEDEERDGPPPDAATDTLNLDTLPYSLGQDRDDLREDIDVREVIEEDEDEEEEGAGGEGEDSDGYEDMLHEDDDDDNDLAVDGDGDDDDEENEGEDGLSLGAPPANTSSSSSLFRDSPQTALPQRHGGVPLEELHEMSRSHRARVICVGDVHGCLDELCELLRKVNYMPGDLVLLLGDLVAKGPKSRNVIRSALTYFTSLTEGMHSFFDRLAMDIGAVSVRGNHDHEVLRQGISFSKKTGKYETRAARKAALKDKVCIVCM